MAQRTDLYTILVAYANKNNSPYVEIDPFLDSLGRYAKRIAEEQPEWLKWVNDKNVKFWAEMSGLAEQGKCELLTDTAGGRIYIPHFYLELLENAYRNADEDAGIPFPCEDSLGIILPENQVRPLSSEYDFLTYLEEPQDSDIPILKINFPDDSGSALVLASMVPKQFAETAILKVRNYLRRYGNKEYAIRKLASQLQGKEQVLQNQFNQILSRPMDCYTDILEGRELAYIFWAHFCVLIKNDIKKKKERLADDIATLQSVYVIEAFNGYFRALANKRREVELAFNNLEIRLSKPPFLFNMEQILKFTAPKGGLLLSQYGREGLENWLRKKTTEGENNKLPGLLVMPGPAGERCYVQKDKLLALCFRLLTEARTRVKDSILSYWRKLLAEYRREPAMESDGEFEKELHKFTRRLCPILSNLFEDPKLLLVYEEMEADSNGVPPAVRIFYKGVLIPYSSLLLLRRRELLTEAKLVLPFWYFLPVISSIIGFFKNLSKRKKKKRESAEDVVLEEKDRAGEIRAEAEELRLVMVPRGHDLESTLEELEIRWSRLIDRKAREDLVDDVKSLIRDYLRRALKVQRQFKLTPETVNQMANNIVTRNPALSALSGRDSLITYTELYILKLLENIK